jgi:Fe-S-cluster containining protein
MSQMAVEQELVLRGEYGSALCVACGMCCHGVLHDHAIAQPDELDKLARLGIPLYEKPVSYDAFQLPCPCHREGLCSVYADRPAVCGSYKCTLLTGVLQSEISYEEARALVQKGRGLFTEILAAIGPSPSGQSIWQQLQSFLAHQRESLADEQFRVANASLLLNVKLLLILLGRHFEQNNFALYSFDDADSGKAGLT